MSSTLMEAAAFAGRLLLAAIFLHEAWSKLTGYPAALAYMQAFGVPGQLLPFAIADFMFAKIIGQGPMDRAKCIDYWGSDVEACNEFAK